MRRSSRILCFLLAATLGPVVAEARGFGGHGVTLSARPSVGMPRMAIRPGVRPGFGRGRLGGGRFGRGYGYGYGLGGYGFGDDGLGDLGFGSGLGLPYGGAFSPSGGDGGAGVRPVFVPVALPPPPCPMIIAVNGGLRNAARTRVVYGARPACGR